MYIYAVGQACLNILKNNHKTNASALTDEPSDSTSTHTTADGSSVSHVNLATDRHFGHLGHSAQTSLPINIMSDTTIVSLRTAVSEVAVLPESSFRIFKQA